MIPTDLFSKEAALPSPSFLSPLLGRLITSRPSRHSKIVFEEGCSIKQKYFTDCEGGSATSNDLFLALTQEHAEARLKYSEMGQDSHRLRS